MQLYLHNSTISKLIIINILVLSECPIISPKKLYSSEQYLEAPASSPHVPRAPLRSRTHHSCCVCSDLAGLESGSGRNTFRSAPRGIESKLMNQCGQIPLWNTSSSCHGNAISPCLQLSFTPSQDTNDFNF